jgi:hypothetical protein
MLQLMGAGGSTTLRAMRAFFGAATAARIPLALALALAGCASAAAPHPIVAAAPSSEGDAPPVSQEAATSRESSPHQTRQMNRVWGWVSLAAGVQGAGLAAVTSFMMLHQNSIRNADCTDKACTTTGLNANREIDSLAPWNAGAWIVGVAGVGIGAFLLLSNPSDKELGVQVGVSPGGAILRGAF